MGTVTQHGYLLLADISGYTSFVAETELEHSHEILSDLLETICEKIETLLTIHKLEGDAVFAYTSETNIKRGETLLELMEVVYVAFRDRQVSIKRRTTCTCNACSNIPSLDLKFIAHHGDYILQDVRGIREMVGSDVNLIHRLLKNHVTETTGWRAYILFTDRCLDHLKLLPEDTRFLTETYDHLGDIKTYSIDLHKRYKEITEERRVIIEEKDADLSYSIDFPTPPALTWEWLQDPLKRNLWSTNVHWYAGDRPGGRVGKGASNHCAHGKGVSTEVMLDWRPFEYSTSVSMENGKNTITEMVRLEELPDGRTRLHHLLKVHFRAPQWLRRVVAKLVMEHYYKYKQQLLYAVQLAGEEFTKLKNESS